MAAADSPLVTVAIPAHNEAERIGRLLEQLRGSAGDRVAEVIICASGCTDSTADVVRECAQRDRRVSLIEGPIGKARAWTELARRTGGPVTVFLDADIRLGTGAIGALVDAMLAAPHLVVATGVPLVDLRGADWRRRIQASWTLPLGFDFVYGGLYAVRLNPLAEAMHNCGLLAPGAPPQIPPDLVVEDIFLDCLLSADQFLVVHDAVAYIEPLDLSDMLRSRARQRVAQAQVQEKFPAVAKRQRGRPALDAAAHRVFWSRLRSPQPVSKVWLVVGMLLRQVLMLLFRRRVRALREQMSADMRAGRGGAVLATSGRVVSKSAAANEAGRD
jgi:Glycosyl transferase family 2